MDTTICILCHKEVRLQATTEAGPHEYDEVFSEEGIHRSYAHSYCIMMQAPSRPDRAFMKQGSNCQRGPDGKCLTCAPQALGRDSPHWDPTGAADPATSVNPPCDVCHLRLSEHTCPDSMGCFLSMATEAYDTQPDRPENARAFVANLEFQQCMLCRPYTEHYCPTRRGLTCTVQRWQDWENEGRDRISRLLGV